MSTKETVIEMIRRMPDQVALPDILARLRTSNPTDQHGVAEGTGYLRTVSLMGHVDDQHGLSAVVPESVAPGPVKVLLILASDDELSAVQWSAATAERWALEWDDPREADYTLQDGEPSDGPR